MPTLTRNLFHGTTERRFELEVAGRWPEDIDGWLFNVGPDRQTPGGHCFVGQGLLFRVLLANPRVTSRRPMTRRQPVRHRERFPRRKARDETCHPHLCPRQHAHLRPARYLDQRRRGLRVRVRRYAVFDLQTLGAQAGEDAFNNIAPPPTINNVSGVYDKFNIVTLEATLEGGSSSAGFDNLNFVPEPGTGVLFGLGLVGLASRRRR